MQPVDRPPPPGGVAQWRCEEWLVAGLVAFGALCRIRQYAANTSLWHDESFVALNVIHKTFRGLLGSLDWHEPSPPGFLAAEKLMVGWLGPSEYALRLLPLTAGIIGLVLSAQLARRMAGSRSAALWAILFLAASPKLIAQSNQVKHFTLDLLVAVVITAAARRLTEQAPPRRVLHAWATASAVGIWFSYAALLVSAATAAWLAPQALSRWPPAERRRFLIANGFVLGSLVLLLPSIFAQRSHDVVGFWAEAFPVSDSPWRFLLWLIRATVALFDYLWQPFGLLLLILALAGSRRYWRAARRGDLLLLCLPVGVAFGLSCAQLWPFGGNQHMVFAAPALVLLIAEGVDALRCRLAIWRPRAAAIAVAVLLAPGVTDALYHLVVPRRRHELRPVIEAVQQRRQPGDHLLVFDPATFAFYTGVDLRREPLDAPRRAPVWVITPRSPRGDLHPDVFAVLSALRRERPELEVVEATGAAAYRFGPAAEAR